MRRVVAAALLWSLAACAGAPPPVVDANEWQLVGITPAAGSAIAGSGSDSIRFSNGRDLDTGLHAARVLGTLSAVHKAPFVVLAGRDCAECGDAIAVYVGSPSDGALAHREGGPFPGRQVDPETHELLFTSRLFVGRCIDAAHEAAVWFYLDGGKDTAKHGAYFIRVENDKIVSKDLPDGNAAGAPQLARTESLAAAGICTEITGREQALQ